MSVDSPDSDIFVTPTRSKPIRSRSSMTPDRNRVKKSKNNPFVIPPVADLLAGREEEKQRTIEKRELIRSMSLAERAEQLKPPVPDYISRTSQRSTISSLTTYRDNASSTSTNSKNAEGGRITEFIQQKREIYLVQMLIDRKSREINRLNRQISSEESELNEQETEIAKSSSLYKIQNAKVESDLAKARKKMEEAVRKRVEATKKLRLFNQQVTTMKSEISKNEDFLESFREYKKFLEQMAPSGADPIKYFKKPDDLLIELNTIEKDNLFLIQQCQILAENENRGKNSVDLDIMKTDDSIKRVQFDLSHIKEVELIDTEWTSNDDLDQQLNYFHKLVDRLFLRCYKKESNVSTIVMLEKIENDLELMYRKIDTIETSFVADKQSGIDKRRREQQRKDKQEKQAEEQRQKTEQAWERATKPIKKRTGRPLVRRSAPVRVRKISDAKLLAQKMEQQRVENLLYGQLF